MLEFNQPTKRTETGAFLFGTPSPKVKVKGRVNTAHLLEKAGSKWPRSGFFPREGTIGCHP
eukprot:1928466-Amphidinium_carterae.2